MIGSRIHSNSSRGFSLAEVLVAVALMSVILLALFGLVTAGVQRAYGGKKMTQSTNIAQAVMERVNVYAPQDMINSTNTSVRSVEWTRVGNTVTGAAESPASTDAITERNAWRSMLASADLPSSTGKPITLKVTTQAVGHTGATFSDAEMVRITVDLSWYERGTRKRQVSLQSLNLRKKP